MNEPEAITLLSFLNRAGLLRLMEDQGAVWADVLNDVTYQDAQEAAREIAKTRLSTERWVVPGDIRSLVIKTRKRRYDRIPAFLREVPELDAFKSAEGPWQDVGSRKHRTFSMTYTRALTDGLDPQIALDRACQSVDIPTTTHEAWASYTANNGALPAVSYATPTITPENEWMFR